MPSIIAPYDIVLASGLEFYPSTESPILTRLIGGGFDSYTKLLLHCDGANGSTVFTDDTGKTVTPNGNAQISTAQSKFGGASGLFDGSGDYLSLADSEDWAFGSGDFTIDTWVRFSSVGGWQVFASQGSGDNSNRWYLAHNGTNLVFDVFTSGSSNISISNNWVPAANTFYHIALTRSGNNFRMFVDGVQVGTTQTNTNSIGNYPGILAIGSETDAGTAFNGHLDEIRISKGIARWTGNFTPPIAAYAGFSTNSPAATHKFNIPGNKIRDIAECLNYLENSLGSTGSLSYAYQLNGGSLVSGQTLAQLKAAIRNAQITVHNDSLIVYVSHVSNGIQQVESAIKMGGGLHVEDPTGGGGGGGGVWGTIR